MTTINAPHATPSSRVRVDLHLHSTASDGCWTPQQLVSQVRDAGIGLFAVADHDTTRSVPEVERLAHINGIGFVPAVEISTTLDGSQIHLLAFGIDPRDPSLANLLQHNWAKLASVDDQSIHKLIQAGYDITWQEYEQYEDDPTRGGWRALNLLIDKGFCRDVHEYVTKLFAGEMALTYPTFALPVEAIEVARQAGGVVICAHPGYSLCDNRAQLEQMLLSYGIEGFECYSPYHNPKLTRHYLDLCHERYLLITAGSDCHGGFAGRSIGQPETYLADLELGPVLSQFIL